MYPDKDNELVRRGSDTTAFIRLDMDVSRLNQIHQYLWIAGRPTNARPLHRQKMIERQIFITEQADLHLVWHESRIFIKPLPDYVFDHQIWNDIICNNAALHASFCGFLLSYVWLLCYPSDFKVAVELGLVSSEVSWNDWTSFVDEFLSNIDCDTLDSVNKRYRYGELRLNRLNIIYRLTHIFESGRLLRGYAYGYSRYTVFFERNFGWTLLVFLYVTLVLTAMQVGLGTTKLEENKAFQQASYGFAVFSIVLPLVVVSVGLLLFSWFFVYHLIATRRFVKSRMEPRQLLRQPKSAELP